MVCIHGRSFAVSVLPTGLCKPGILSKKMWFKPFSHIHCSPELFLNLPNRGAYEDKNLTLSDHRLAGLYPASSLIQNLWQISLLYNTLDDSQLPYVILRTFSTLSPHVWVILVMWQRTNAALSWYIHVWKWFTLLFHSIVSHSFV